MPFITVGSGSSDVSAGTHEGTLIAINEKMVPSKFTPDGSDAPAYEWVFALADGSEVNGLTSTYVTPKSKAFSYLVALLGKEKVTNGAGFELDDLIGKTALLSIEINENGWPRITGVMPPMARPAAPVARPVAVPVATPALPEDEKDEFSDLPF